MQTISLWQPWASAICVGLKTIETRSWFTPQRGRIAIHAAKTQRDPDSGERLADWWERVVVAEATFHAAFAAAGYHSWKDLPFGAVVATADLVDCVPTQRLFSAVPSGSTEYRWGNYDPGRWGWILRNVQQLKWPAPCIGRQGWFDCTCDVGLGSPAAELEAKQGRALRAQQTTFPL